MRVCIATLLKYIVYKAGIGIKASGTEARVKAWGPSHESVKHSMEHRPSTNLSTDLGGAIVRRIDDSSSKRCVVLQRRNQCGINAELNIPTPGRIARLAAGRIGVGSENIDP